MWNTARLNEKLKKKEFKIRAALKRIPQDINIMTQQAHTRHADSTRHEVILPGLTLTEKSNELSGILVRTRDLRNLTDETIERRVRWYKDQPQTVFISWRTVSDRLASVYMDEPELQTRASEECPYILHLLRCRLKTQSLQNNTATKMDT